MPVHLNYAPWQAAAIYNPFEHFAMLGGVATGKTRTGASFAINHFRRFPHLDGFIGANTYDQLSQATLRMLFERLEEQKIPYVIHQRPPASWGARQRFPTYKNILTIKLGTKIVTAYVRVLSDPDALRGIEFSWYWIDETRDTPENTHDVLISRMRQSKYRKGLITSTTNSEDWVFKKMVKARKGQRLFGSMHVKTIEAVKLGIIPQAYYDAMLASYSPLMAAQELDALHVNVHGGRAYYAFAEHNRSIEAPWGETHPNPTRPLILGCDFNFDPSPHIWMVGQKGPAIVDPRDGLMMSDKIHWFTEIAMKRASTVSMAQVVAARYPEFQIRVFGDRSGMRTTTSSAGSHDYNQIAKVFSEHGIAFTIDSDQSNNPLVRNRVENMNRMAQDGQGNTRLTYNQDQCPHFDADVKLVGWKQNSRTGHGKLDSGGDVERTHASDGAGYAVWKLFPLGSRGRLVQSVKSLSAQELGNYDRGGRF